MQQKSREKSSCQNTLHWQVLQKVITKKLPKPITCIGESDKIHMN